MDAANSSPSRRKGRTLATLLSDAAARQATTPTVRIVSHATRGQDVGDPHIALFTGPAAGGVASVASFSFGTDFSFDSDSFSSVLSEFSSNFGSDFFSTSS